VDWLRVGVAAAFWVGVIAWLLWRITRDECPECKGSGEQGKAGRLCSVCMGTGNRPQLAKPGQVTWRMEIGKGGRLWWTASTGVQVCGLCYDTFVVVDHIAGYRTVPCPECSRPEGKDRPYGKLPGAGLGPWTGHDGKLRCAECYGMTGGCHMKCGTPPASHVRPMGVAR
jgi:hypothetical protein